MTTSAKLIGVSVKFYGMWIMTIDAAYLYETFYFAHKIHEHTPHHQSARQHDRLAPAYPATRLNHSVESDREKNHYDVPMNESTPGMTLC